jgi:hypothetical protein
VVGSGSIYSLANLTADNIGSITRLYNQAVTTIRNFLTDGGRDNWIVIAQGVVVDLSNAIYSKVTNLFKALMNGSFIENLSINGGESVVPHVVISSLTPYVDGDDSTKTHRWNPSIDWDTSTTCIYSYDSDFEDPTTVTCSDEDTSLPRPTGDNLNTPRTLYLRGTDSDGNISEKSITYFYDTITPVATTCGTDILDEDRIYYLGQNTTANCSVTANATLLGSLTATSTRYTLTGGVSVTGEDLTVTLTNMTVSSSTLSYGNDLIIQRSVLGSISSNGIASTTGNGGDAGNITIATSSVATSITANGGNGRTNGGNGGDVTIRASLGKPSTTTITANGGSSTYCGFGGNGGDITLVNSLFGTLTSESGADMTEIISNGGHCANPPSGSSGSSGSHNQEGSFTPGDDFPGGHDDDTSDDTPDDTPGGDNHTSSPLLQNLIKKVLTPLTFTPITPFTPFSPLFNPAIIGATSIPDPFKNFQAPGILYLINLPVNFMTNISKFLFAPLPESLSQALSNTPELAAYIGAFGVSMQQQIASLALNPVPLATPRSDESTPPGLFIINSGGHTLTSYVTYDKAVGGLAQLVTVSPGQSLNISLIPQSTGPVTATYLGQDITFAQGSLFATSYITSPAHGGRYVLKTTSSPIPLLIDVIAPIQEEVPVSKPWGIFNFIWKWFNK